MSEGEGHLLMCSWLQYLFMGKEDNDICNYFSGELCALKLLKINLTLEAKGFPILTLKLLADA